MFESNVKAVDFIERIKNEVDAAPDIDNDTYLAFIDEAEQLLYSEIIKEIHAVKPTITEKSYVKLPYETEIGAAFRFEDVREVYAGDVQLVKTTAIGGKFPDCYCKLGNDLYIYTDSVDDITVYYHIRPKLKRGTDGEDTIKLPPEWIPLVAAKARGEALKLVNEDSAAAKWFADYNALLEQFKEYFARREADLNV